MVLFLLSNSDIMAAGRTELSEDASIHRQFRPSLRE